MANNPADGTLLGLNDLSVTVLSVVPEPSTWALVGLGALAVLLYQRKRRRA